MRISVREARSTEERASSWAIREAVFIQEQGIAEADERDGLDDLAWHLLAFDEERRAVMRNGARHRFSGRRNGARHRFHAEVDERVE